MRPDVWAFEPSPTEVRRWLEQELFATFGLQPPTAELDSPQLAAFGVEEATAVLSLIQGRTLGAGRLRL